MIVMKFGGTSVKDDVRIRNVCEIVRQELPKKPVVVSSAAGGITDLLIETAKRAMNDGDFEETLKKIKDRHYDIVEKLKLDKNLVEPLLFEFEELVRKIYTTKSCGIDTMDLVQSFGERLSIRLVAAELTNQGIPAEAFDAWDIGMITNSDFGKAEPIEGHEKLMKQSLLNKKIVPVITGFIGKTKSGIVTTFGRGGSDYTAAIIGAAIDAKEIQIWTDVDGMMTTDPRIVKEVKTIPKISFAEASELAYFGAKVLHPKTILPAMKKDIPVLILNTYNPKGRGTTIVREVSKTNEVAKAIACKKKITLVNIDSTRMLGAHGFLARVFNVFDEYKKPVDMIATTEVSISLTVDNEENMDKIVKELKEIAEIKVERNKAIVCVVGAGMRHTHGVAGRIFTALGKANINVEMISQGASEINVSFIVEEKEADEAVRVLHKELFG